MATSNMNIRMDSQVKAQAQALFAQLGLDMTTAVNIFLRQSIRERGIPFPLYLREPNAETIAAIEDVEAGRNLHGPFDSVSEMMASLMEGIDD